MKTSRLLMGLGAAAMAVAPVAAQAGTRAADAGAIAVQPVKMSAVERGTEGVTTKSEIGGTSAVIAVLAAIAVIVGIIIATDDDTTD
ncbi:hypothetical protein [Qipengyuania vesicularis]|uniref:hypothetical protein n=1 Tax=Qipengyuania vesicularis TaxID=2867232 RepID=UPI001C87EC52|nr:hypothetical protein [Qipengyuania vesicularis]MBX7526668.1 hypothetical protein [Qipengyuania vesicularis]